VSLLGIEIALCRLPVTTLIMLIARNPLSSWPALRRRSSEFTRRAVQLEGGGGKNSINMHISELVCKGPYTLSGKLSDFNV
jgi:hypothetical protein